MTRKFSSKILKPQDTKSVLCLGQGKIGHPGIYIKVPIGKIAKCPYCGKSLSFTSDKKESK